MDTYMDYNNCQAGVVFEHQNIGFVIMHVINLGFYKVLVTIDAAKCLTIFSLGRRSKNLKCLHSFDIDQAYHNLLSYQ